MEENRGIFRKDWEILKPVRININHTNNNKVEEYNLSKAPQFGTSIVVDYASG